MSSSGFQLVSGVARPYTVGYSHAVTTVIGAPNVRRELRGPPQGLPRLG